MFGRLISPFDYRRVFNYFRSEGENAKRFEMENKKVISLLNYLKCRVDVFRIQILECLEDDLSAIYAFRYFRSADSMVAFT